MNALLIVFVISGACIALALIIQAFRIRKHAPHLAPVDNVKTELDRTIAERFKDGRAVVLKAAHFDRQAMRQGFIAVLRVIAVLALYLWTLVHDFLQKMVKTFQGNNAPQSGGAPSFFLKEVQYFKDQGKQ